jgi:hypothetical protein
MDTHTHGAADMTARLLTEPRISLTALARRENVHLSTVWRWCLRGVRGIRLECISIGLRKYTTLPAYERWIARINGEPVGSSSPRQREAAISRAEQRANELGV